MPWLETSPMEGRERFIRDHRLDLYPMRELCARYGISRKTGYKWLMRFEDAGRRGLQDRSRAPHQCPHRIAEDVADMICAAHALIRSGSRRSTTASGRFTSATSSWAASTNATTSSGPSHLSPMFPVCSVTYPPGCSDCFTNRPLALSGCTRRRRPA
jgi:putative transposase